MRWKWRCVLLLAALTANNLITGSLGQDTTPAPATDSAGEGGAEPTASQLATDAPESPDTPAPTDGIGAEEEEEEEENESLDTPSPIQEDTPSDDGTLSPEEGEGDDGESTPSPVEEVEEKPEPTEAEEEEEEETNPPDTPSPTETPEPTVRWTFAPADPWTESPGATPAPQRVWTQSPGATPAPQRVWTPPPTVKQTWAPVAPWTASPGATPAPVAPWTASPGATWAPVAPWTASPGATPAPVAPWTASPGATWAPVAPWTASPGATWAPAAPWTAAPGATWAPARPWTGPPTVAMPDLLSLTRAANEAGEFEGQFDTVLAGLEYADLGSLLEGEALMTVFLPTDDAFDAEGITDTSITSLPLPVVQNLLRYHLLEGAVSSEVLAEAENFYTVLKVNLAVQGGDTLVDGEGNARSVVGEEMRASNGYAYVVDGVLFPPDLVTLAESVNARGGSFEGVFDIFLAAVRRTGLVRTLSGVEGLYTVFAPADFAFESIGITNETVLTFDLGVLTGLVGYHVVPNEMVGNSTLTGPLREFDTLLSGSALRNTADGAGAVLDGTGARGSVLAADLRAVNGYLHAIDTVLEWSPLFTQSPTSAPTATPILRDLVGTLVAENEDRDGDYFGQFDTMIAALSASGLDLELELPGPFTVFAPTNAAFLSIGVGPDNVDDVAPSVLEKLLLYHILPGSVPRESIARHAALYTSLGVNLETSGATLVDSEGTAVSLLGPDVAASNGYLHYVDGVLMPPDLMTSLSTYNEPGGSYEGVFDTLIEGLRVTDMWGDFKGLEGPFTMFAPTDSAFALLKLNSSNIGEANLTSLAEVLRYHVIGEEMTTTSMSDGDRLRTLSAGAGYLVVVGEGKFLEDANGERASVAFGNMASSNGVLHMVDSVLLPFSSSRLLGNMFPAQDRGVEDGSSDDGGGEVAALSAGLAAAAILVATAFAVHKRRQADAARPPKVSPDDGGWGMATVRGAPVHPV